MVYGFTTTTSILSNTLKYAAAQLDTNQL